MVQRVGEGATAPRTNGPEPHIFCTGAGALASPKFPLAVGTGSGRVWRISCL